MTNQLNILFLVLNPVHAAQVALIWFWRKQRGKIWIMTIAKYHIHESFQFRLKWRKHYYANPNVRIHRKTTHTHFLSGLHFILDFLMVIFERKLLFNLMKNPLWWHCIQSTIKTYQWNETLKRFAASTTTKKNNFFLYNDKNNQKKRIQAGKVRISVMHSSIEGQKVAKSCK